MVIIRNLILPNSLQPCPQPSTPSTSSPNPQIRQRQQKYQHHPIHQHQLTQTNLLLRMDCPQGAYFHLSILQAVVCIRPGGRHLSQHIGQNRKTLVLTSVDILKVLIYTFLPVHL